MVGVQKIEEPVFTFFAKAGIRNGHLNRTIKFIRLQIKIQQRNILRSIGLNTLKVCRSSAFRLKEFGIGKTSGSENQVIAIISFSDDANIEEIDERNMKSKEFADDMASFDKSKITNVESKVMSAKLP